MSRIAAGAVMPDFSYVTPFSAQNLLSETVRRVSGKTALVFLRYYGCRMCQLDLLDFTEEYSKITAKNGQLLTVLQSAPQKLARQFAEERPPFDIICDPGQKLYQMLEIPSAASKEALKDDSSMAKFQRVLARNLRHGEYEGNELQLPAAFILDHGLHVTYAHYGRVITDIPSADELAALL